MTLETVNSLYRSFFGGNSPGSLEKIAAFNPDAIFVYPSVSLDDISFVSELEKSEVWKSLPAYKNGKAFALGQHWRLGTPLGYEWKLTDIVRLLEKK